jgi:endonuclease IV
MVQDEVDKNDLNCITDATEWLQIIKEIDIENKIVMEQLVTHLRDSKPCLIHNQDLINSINKNKPSLRKFCLAIAKENYPQSQLLELINPKT